MLKKLKKIMDIICKHYNLEKINDQIFICKDCSLIRLIEFKKNKNIEYTKLLLSKDNYYNIKNEINIFHLTKIAINFNYNFNNDNIEIKDIFLKNSSLYLKFREKLIKHIYNLCSEINSSYECYYLSILLLDIIIHKVNYIINNYQLDLFCTICFIISKKFIEKDLMKVEKYNNYLTICHSPQKFIVPNDLILAEIECLKILKYQLNIPTSFTIINYMFICGIIFEDEIKNNYSNINKECLNLLLFCTKTNEISFYYNPILISFSIIYLIRRKYELKMTDTLDLFSLFDIKFSQIKECVKLISKLYFNKNIKKTNNIMNDKIIIKRSYSQIKRVQNKNKKRSFTPNKYENFHFDDNYYIMSIKDYKIERSIIKEYNEFFRNFIRKRKLYDKIIKNSSSYFNNFNNSINRNDNLILDKDKNIYRNATKIL